MVLTQRPDRSGTILRVGRRVGRTTVERILLRRVPVVFPFFCGIYLFRLQMRAESSRIRLPLTLLAGILLAVLLIPMVVGNWPYENLAVLIVFPAIVRL